ncbi:MAG: MipA/OmpV family protein, partial [Steroidobacteraceae bacterium]
MKYVVAAAAMTALIGLVLTPSRALADEDSEHAPPKDGWDVSVGGGPGVRPTYEGSDRYVVTPLPFVSATYDDWLSMGPDGLNAYWHQGNFRIGAGPTFDDGREDKNSNGPFTQGDDRLKGLGDIEHALGVRVLSSYKLGPVVFDGSVTKLTHGGNDGVLAHAGVALPYELTDKFSLTLSVGTTWANKSYMQTYFGVTPIQA